MRFLTKLWLAQFSILMLVVAIFAGSSILVMDRIIHDNHARILAGRLEAIERELDALTLEAGIGRAVVRDVLRRHDPPPLNWSILKVRILKEDRYGEEGTQARRDCFEAATG